MNKIKLFYSDWKTGNFGDILNVDLFTKLFNCNVEWTYFDKCDVIGVGSILNRFIETPKGPVMSKNKVIVWGSGLIRGTYTKLNKFSRPLDIRALRGKLTLRKTEEILGKKLGNITLGDPGLLASKLYPSTGEKKYKWGIIPHYVDKESPLLKKFKLENSVVINVLDKPEKVCKKISECENIISSSLHGLIIADSYNIQNIRMVLSDKIIGGNFKYNDYYSVFGINHKFLNMKSCGEIKDLKLSQKVPYDKVLEIQEELTSVFPFK